MVGRPLDSDSCCQTILCMHYFDTKCFAKDFVALFKIKLLIMFCNNGILKCMCKMTLLNC